MNTLALDIKDLHLHRDIYKALNEIDGESNHREFANKINRFPDGRMILAIENNVILGIYCYSYTTNISDSLAAILGPHHKAAIPHDIWVRTEYRNQGVGTELRGACFKDARARKFTHILHFLPSTLEIKNWSLKRPGWQDTGLYDADGNQIMVLKL
jgi:GNAT superfamily N-acetyltransferase